MIKEEFNLKGLNISYDIFKSELLEKYELGEKLGFMEILKIEDDKIVTVMPLYTMLIDNPELYDVNKMGDLINRMKMYNIVHKEISPRTIGIDKDGNYQLTDLSLLSIA
jgi:hypothetical protein